ncbi:MAG: DUF4250 domain-containing protein [Rikenellaceae bacterium]
MDSNIPKDPMMLYSFINMKLRDQYCNLDELCEDMGVDRSEIVGILSSAGFEYNEELNKVW